MPFPTVFDNSMLSAYKTCPQKFFREYVQHWKPKSSSVDLHAGKAFASGVEEARRLFHEVGDSAEAAYAAGRQVLSDAYGDFVPRADSPKTRERMLGAYDFYWENYPLGADHMPPHRLDNGRLGIELGFVEPLPVRHPETGEPLLYCGRADMVADFAGGVYLVDEKTTKQLGPTWADQWSLRAQFTSYAWGFRRANVPITGVIVRGVSILKTKYETQQAISYRPTWMVEQWYEETCRLLEEIVAAYQQGHWRHDWDSGCTAYGGCLFRRVCQSETPDSWLPQYFEIKQWNPVTREEIKQSAQAQGEQA